MAGRDKESLSSCRKWLVPITWLKGNQRRSLPTVGAPYTMVGWFIGWMKEHEGHPFCGYWRPAAWTWYQDDSSEHKSSKADGYFPKKLPTLLPQSPWQPREEALPSRNEN